MPNRYKVPPVLRGRHPSLVAHFWRDYYRAVALEEALPPEQRHVTNTGPAKTAIGWVLRRDYKYTPAERRYLTTNTSDTEIPDNKRRKRAA